MRGQNISFLDAVQELFEAADVPYVFGEQGVPSKRDYKYPHEEPLNNKENVYGYMKTRGISQSTVDYADVREDAHGNCVFNYYDLNDVLTNVKYRPSHKINKAAGESKMWAQRGADTTPLLFNMNRVSTDSPLLCCEGEMDTLAAIEAGYHNAVSVPFGANNFTWIEENWDFLEQFDSIIVAGDNDEPGQKMNKEVVNRLGSWRTKYVQIPSEMTNKETGEVVKVKDLNEVLYYGGKDALLSAILNAKDTPVVSVTDLSDIDDVDLDQIDGVQFGIEAIDKELMRLFYGTLTIVSGMPGAGKTSFLYQTVCNAMDTGHNCWLFSRELPGWMSKNWFSYILAGPRHLTEHYDSNGAHYFKVDPGVKRDINDYYRGQWYVYNDNDSNKLDDLIGSMTDVVRKYGVKLLILDNLMTIDIGAGANDELKKQTEAISKLIQFAMKYDVAVILVAHPRKMMAGTEVGLYDLAGSSNIINLAHRTISLRRVTKQEKEGKYNMKGQMIAPPDPSDVKITVLKDRLRGRAGFSCGMFYDVPSRRFFTTPAEYGRQYRWDRGEYKSPLAYPIPDPLDEVFGGDKAE